MFDLFSWSHILILLIVALVVVGPKDLPRLMNMAGKLQREGSQVRVRHVAEVLAGMGDLPAIGEPERGGPG